MADITRWDPFRELWATRDEAEHLLDRTFGRPWRFATWDRTDSMFPVDLYETDEEVILTAPLPGVKPEDVQISVTGETITIKGEVKEEHEEEKPNYYRQERHYGAFQRALALPVQVDADKAEASFEDGVLKLRLPKVPEIRPKTIEVKPKPVA